MNQEKRILARKLARDLTPEEIKQVTGAGGDVATLGDCQAGGTYTTSGCSTRKDDADV